MSNLSLNTQIKIPKVAIIIPCYKASKTIRFVVKNILKEFSLLKNKFSCKIILIDDFCPEKSWLKINDFKDIKIIHNKINLGVGGATLNGIQYALKNNYSNPTEPAVKPTMQKKENSRRSLGRDFRIKFN